MLNNLKMRWLVITITLDMLLTVIALLLARWLRGYFPAGLYLDDTFSLAPLEEPLYFAPTFLIPLVIIIWLVVFSALSVYSTKFTLSHYQRVQPIFVAVTGAILIFAGVAYFFLRDLSRLMFVYFYILDVLLLVTWRKTALYFMKKTTLKNNAFLTWQPKHRILIVGQGQLAQDVAAAIKTFAWSGLNLIGFAGDKPDALGPISDVPELVSKLTIDEVIFALPPGHQSILQKLVFKLQPLSVNLRLVPDVIDLVFVRATIEDFAGLPLIGLRQPAIDVFDLLIKRTFDIIVSSILLILSSPLFLLITILIKLNSKGSIFYTSQRIGEGGKIFTMHKFRTMIEGANQQETTLLKSKNGGLGLAKRPDDPRITPIGRFLRRTSLDELPQLFDVLRGSMSLVGPRPELPWLVDHYEPWQYQRFTVPQGITGWWQVKNRDKQDQYNVRVEDDLYYIHNYSFLLDLRILWLTMGAVIRGDGAF